MPTGSLSLLHHGLLRPSFIPPVNVRELRALPRHRSNFVRERATVVNRVQQVLEGANIKLASVATDVLGVSGRAMLNALGAGDTDPEVMAELALRANAQPFANCWRAPWTGV